MMSDDDIYCIGDDDIRERLVISIFTLCSPHIPVAPLLICTMAGFIRWATTLTELIGGGQFPAGLLLRPDQPLWILFVPHPQW